MKNKIKNSYYGNKLNKFNKFLKISLLAIGIMYILFYLVIVYFRIRYPFELEWMEGEMLNHTLRIISGEQIYVKPTLEFIPFIYTPLYFYLSALFVKMLGVSFLPLRLISFVSSIGCFFMIYLFVKKETKSIYLGVLSMSLFAATYKISGAWFDIGRVDSLFLFLLLIGLFLLKFKNTIWMFILSAIIFSLAFLTKQTALIIFLPTIIYCILVKRRNGFYYIGTFILLIISSTILFNILHNGWYTYYVFNLPSQHPILFDMISHFWITDILLPLSVGFFLSIYYLYFLFTKSIKKINNIISYCNGNENLIFYSLFFLGMVGASFFSRIHQGGYDNVLIPAYAIISILFGLSLHQILNNNKKIQKNIILQTFVLIICILQFCCLFYNPFNQLPTNKDLVAGENLVKELKNIEGEVFIPFHGYLSIIADKKNYAHQMAIYDIIRANDDDIKKELNDEIKNSMQDKKFDAIIIDHPWFFQELIDANYNKKENVFNDNEVFFPKTGAKLRPEYIYKI